MHQEQLTEEMEKRGEGVTGKEEGEKAREEGGESREEEGEKERGGEKGEKAREEEEGEKEGGEEEGEKEREEGGEEERQEEEGEKGREEEKGDENEGGREGEGRKEPENVQEDGAKEGGEGVVKEAEGSRTERDSEQEPLKSSEIETEFKSPGRASNSDSQLSSDSRVDGILGAHRQDSSTEEMLAIMGVDGAHPRKLSSHISVESSSSADSLLSDHPCFLHIRVSQNCSAAHTYTPLNRAVGVDIPHKSVNSPALATVQQVKTVFCFAVAERRLVEV